MPTVGVIFYDPIQYLSRYSPNVNTPSYFHVKNSRACLMYHLVVDKLMTVVWLLFYDCPVKKKIISEIDAIKLLASEFLSAAQ